MLYITDQNGNVLTRRGVKLVPTSETTKIVSKMQDGSFAVQQIGSAAKKTTVSMVTTDKAAWDDLCESCAVIVVYHQLSIITGIISSESIAWAPVAPGIRKWRGTFEMTVTSEAER